MIRIGLVLLGILALACNLGACTEKKAEQPEGQTAGSSPSTAKVKQLPPPPGQGGHSSTAAPSASETSAISTAGALPQGWPAELSPYPGASIVRGERIENEKGDTTLSATLVARATVSEVVDYYEQQTDSANYEIQQAMVDPVNATMVYAQGDKLLNVDCNLAEDEVTILLALGPGEPIPPEARELAYMGIGRLPPAFREDLLPLYPNAELIDATCSSWEYRHLQASEESREEILNYYRKHYDHAGWHAEQEGRAEDQDALLYTSSTGEITITVNAAPDGKQEIVSQLLLIAP